MSLQKPDDEPTVPQPETPSDQPMRSKFDGYLNKSMRQRPSQIDWKAYLNGDTSKTQESTPVLPPLERESTIRDSRAYNFGTPGNSNKSLTSRSLHNQSTQPQISALPKFPSHDPKNYDHTLRVRGRYGPGGQFIVTGLAPNPPESPQFSPQITPTGLPDPYGLTTHLSAPRPSAMLMSPGNDFGAPKAASLPSLSKEEEAFWDVPDCDSNNQIDWKTLGAEEGAPEELTKEDLERQQAELNYDLRNLVSYNKKTVNEPGNETCRGQTFTVKKTCGPRVKHHHHHKRQTGPIAIHAVSLNEEKRRLEEMVFKVPLTEEEIAELLLQTKKKKKNMEEIDHRKITGLEIFKGFYLCVLALDKLFEELFLFITEMKERFEELIIVNFTRMTIKDFWNHESINSKTMMTDILESLGHFKFELSADEEHALEQFKKGAEVPFYGDKISLICTAQHNMFDHRRFPRGQLPKHIHINISDQLMGIVIETLIILIVNIIDIYPGLGIGSLIRILQRMMIIHIDLNEEHAKRYRPYLALQ